MVCEPFFNASDPNSSSMKVIMVLRVYALYGGRATTLCLLLIFVVVEAVVLSLSLFNGFGES